jgi:hypothetical protein
VGVPLILDQRQMLLGVPAGVADADAVTSYWTRFLERKGMQPVEDDRKVTAYVNFSRWVANCPECNGGIACWPEHKQGCCLDCGHVYRVVFPSRPQVELATTALLRVPAKQRHWRPDLGQTAADVVAGRPPKYPDRRAREIAEAKAAENRAAEGKEV